ncbi:MULTISPECIES: LacI family DNA-binding transcriptional regulator [unclassified Frondihabitans]|uniref:LacI family DNA-binding transcriptional regulator n=1 Tax=unclassified Frondihabitans TaxID=2626248 RepID=UPI000F507B8F|nr:MULTISPECIES: LacI family DNA-binding transcriptional regulator [unclassified Frondihabitans]RPE78383.1 LacI family transcriptional regulator [Frondihabitans sp. PhB153]RPF08664.1 LacI family transcriptional regulator [Frondihabitans sp. PhB161]
MASTNGRRVTLKDVAQKVGVTPAAVSMALLDNGRISAEKKIAIRQAATELGYVGSSAARALRNQKTNTIALIVPLTATHVFGHSYFTHVLQGVTEACNRRDVQTLLATNADEAHGLAAYERVLRGNMVDGAVVTSAAMTDSTVQRLSQGGVPVVLIGNFPYLDEPVTVGIDDRAASALATRHLLEVHGRKRLIHVAGPRDHQTGLDRSLGFADAVREAGVDEDSLIVESDLTEQGGATVVDELGSRLADYDGMVFANDDMAFGAITALTRLDIAVPTEMSVVGFDDFGLARVVSPGISTVRVPVEEMARDATERLLQIVDGVPGWTRRDFDVQFIARESCGCSATETPREL